MGLLGLSLFEAIENHTLRTIVSTKPVGGCPEEITGMSTEILQHSNLGTAGTTANCTGCGCGTPVLFCNSPTDSCTTVTDIQSLFTGQQLCSNGISNEVFPEQAHFSTPTPPAPNTNSISVVIVIIMLENNLISGCKDTQKKENTKKEARAVARTPNKHR